MCARRVLGIGMVVVLAGLLMVLMVPSAKALPAMGNAVTGGSPGPSALGIERGWNALGTAVGADAGWEIHGLTSREEPPTEAGPNIDIDG